jgi:hypothetical protein
MDLIYTVGLERTGAKGRGAHLGLAVGDGAAVAVALVVTVGGVMSVPGLGEDDDEVQRAEAGHGGAAKGCFGWPRLMAAELGLAPASNLDVLVALFGWRCGANRRGEPGLLIEGANVEAALTPRWDRLG